MIVEVSFDFLVHTKLALLVVNYLLRLDMDQSAAMFKVLRGTLAEIQCYDNNDGTSPHLY